MDYKIDRPKLLLIVRACYGALVETLDPYYRVYTKKNFILLNIISAGIHGVNKFFINFL